MGAPTGDGEKGQKIFRSSRRCQMQTFHDKHAHPRNNVSAPNIGVLRKLSATDVSPSKHLSKGLRIACLVRLTALHSAKHTKVKMKEVKHLVHGHVSLHEIYFVGLPFYNIAMPAERFQTKELKATTVVFQAFTRLPCRGSGFLTCLMTLYS